MMIITISKKGKISEYAHFDLTFHHNRTTKKRSEKEGEKGILEALSETFTVDEIAKFTHKKSEIIEILDS